jgi:AcrR family transcriptional regulator
MFGMWGYEAATLRDIAREAGLSTGALFASFSGKEEIYREACGRGPITSEMGSELLEALKKLSFAAQITGGTAGRDEHLCAAIDVAIAAIAKATGAAITKAGAPVHLLLSATDGER